MNSIINTLIVNQEEKRVQERRRHLVYLIAAFLREQGWARIYNLRYLY